MLMCVSPVLYRIVSLLGVSAPQQASFFSTWTLLLVSHCWLVPSNTYCN
jgi:hypothetical protein